MRPALHGGLILALGLLLGGLPLAADRLEAQTPPPRGGELSRQEMQSRIIRGFENRLVRELGMSQSDLEQVQKILREHRAERGQLMRDRRELNRALARFLEQGGSDAEATRLLSSQQELRAREVTLQQQEEVALLEVLSPAKLIRFHKMRDELVERIRELERRDGPDRTRSHSPRDPSSSGSRHTPS